MNELATQQSAPRSAIATLASRLGVDPAKLVNTLKQTVFKGASDEELMALTIVANEYRLNPFTKEIYAFPAKGGGIVPVVSVDGWVRMINEHPQMDGLDFEFTKTDGKLESCTAIIWRKDRSRPIRVTEYLTECRRSTEPWKMEHRMLRHKALIQCGRVAFGFGGVYDDEEAEPIIEKKATARVVNVESPRPAKAIEGRTEPVSEKPAVPASERATPLQGLRNLCKSAGISDAQMLAWFKSQGAVIDQATSLEAVGDLELREASTQFVDLIADIKAVRPDEPAAEEGKDIPSDPAEVLALLREHMEAADIDEAAVVAFMKEKKHTGPKVVKLSEIGSGRLAWLLENWTESAAAIKEAK
jgi:phage recombination protein Bet